MTSSQEVNYATSRDQRTLGQFYLSISTSLAIESLCGIYPETPVPIPPIKKYDVLWVNLRTLYRNLMGAIPKDHQIHLTPAEIGTLMVEEIETIPDMLKEYAGKPVPVRYYISTFRRIKNRYPYAEIREDTTPKQKLFTQTLDEVMVWLYHNHRNLFSVFEDDIYPAVEGNKLNLDQLNHNALILTHLAFDLLSSKRFDHLTLIESHTGKLKSSAFFSSKFYQGKELSMIPFTIEMLQVFGDTEMFHPLPIGLRKDIIELATRRKWSSATTRARIVDNLPELKNPAHLLRMKQIYGLLI